MLYIKEQKGNSIFQLQIECLDEPYSESFPFSRYGGSREEALAAAKNARDVALEVFADEISKSLGRSYVRTNFSSNNNTGIIGINRTYEKNDDTRIKGVRVKLKI